MLILKDRQRGATIIETDAIEILFVAETPLAFRRKDLDMRAFVVNRRLSQFDGKILDNWLNGQEFSIVSETSTALAIKSSTGDPAPNTAPVVRFFTPNIDIVANTGFPYVIPTAGTASVTDDGLLGPLTYLWTQESGPGILVVAFSDETSGAPTISFPGAGTYVIRATADDGELTGFADIIVDITD